MSRSYKKNPYCGDHKGKIKKRIANHIIRQKLKNPDFECKHMSYKNAGMDRWDMCDFHSIQSWKSYWNSELRWYNRVKDEIHYYPIQYKKKYENGLNKKEIYRDWYKWYKMK